MSDKFVGKATGILNSRFNTLQHKFNTLQHRFYSRQHAVTPGNAQKAKSSYNSPVQGTQARLLSPPRRQFSNFSHGNSGKSRNVFNADDTSNAAFNNINTGVDSVTGPKPPVDIRLPTHEEELEIAEILYWTLRAAFENPNVSLKLPLELFLGKIHRNMPVEYYAQFAKSFGGASPSTIQAIVNSGNPALSAAALWKALSKQGSNPHMKGHLVLITGEVRGKDGSVEGHHSAIQFHRETDKEKLLAELQKAQEKILMQPISGKKEKVKLGTTQGVTRHFINTTVPPKPVPSESHGHTKSDQLLQSLSATQEISRIANCDTIPGWYIPRSFILIPIDENADDLQNLLNVFLAVEARNKELSQNDKSLYDSLGYHDALSNGCQTHDINFILEYLPELKELAPEKKPDETPLNWSARVGRAFLNQFFHYVDPAIDPKSFFDHGRYSTIEARKKNALRPESQDKLHAYADKNNITLVESNALLNNNQRSTVLYHIVSNNPLAKQKTEIKTQDNVDLSDNNADQPDNDADQPDNADPSINTGPNDPPVSPDNNSSGNTGSNK